jgi:hypothetical protein
MTPDSVASALVKHTTNGETSGVDIDGQELKGAWSTHGEIHPIPTLDLPSHCMPGLYMRYGEEWSMAYMVYIRWPFMISKLASLEGQDTDHMVFSLSPNDIYLCPNKT